MPTVIRRHVVYSKPSGTHNARLGYPIQPKWNDTQTSIMRSTGAVPVLPLVAEPYVNRIIVSIYVLLLRARTGRIATEGHVSHMSTEYRGHGTQNLRFR